ncbi:hypothetical protein BKA70DRAFT_1230593 [Coprinopsis sp. MPI-PUGE-AT-0042]|nr:hypothetical protein BKA70DRAFT_1230593 [Coprinopsis sp. MPI-PUGE-AT-0042]
MARNKTNAPPTRRSVRLGGNTNNPSSSEDQSVPPPAPPAQDLLLDIHTTVYEQRAPKRKHQDNEPVVEKPQKPQSASVVDAQAHTASHAQGLKKAHARKESKAKRAKKMTGPKPRVSSTNNEATPKLAHDTVGLNQSRSINSPQVSARLPSFGTLPVQPAHIAQGFIQHNVRHSPSVAQGVRQDSNSSPPPAFVHDIEPSQSFSKPAPTFFGSVPTEPITSDRISVGERLLRLQSSMVQRNTALDQPLTGQFLQRSPQQDVFSTTQSNNLTEQTKQGSPASFSLPAVFRDSSFDTEHRAKRLKTVHPTQCDSPLKHATQHCVGSTMMESDPDAPSSTCPLQPKPFVPLIPSPDVSQASADRECTNTNDKEPSVALPPPITPPPFPTPPTNSLLPYRTALPRDLPAPTDKVFLMVGRTHPDYPDYAFNSRVIGRIFPRPAGYTPTGFECYTTFWRQGMVAPLLIPPTHTTSGVVTGHLPHVVKEWQNVHRFLANRRASNNTVGLEYPPPSDHSDASVIESPESGSDFEDTQLALRQRGKPTSLSPPSSEEETDKDAATTHSKRSNVLRDKGKDSNLPDKESSKPREGKGKAKGQPSLPSAKGLRRDEQEALNEIVADLSHLSSLTRLGIFPMLSIVGMYHPSAAQRPEEPDELTHDERTSIFDLESRLSAFADGLNIEWYQVLEMVGITYEPNRALPPGPPAYHPNRAHVSPPQPAPLNTQSSSRRQRKCQRQRTRSKSPHLTHFGSDEENELRLSPPFQHSSAPGDAQQQARQQKKKCQRLREASDSSRSTSPKRRKIACQPSAHPPQPATAMSAGQATIDNTVRQVVELAQVFGVHPFELLRWGGVSDPELVNDGGQLQAPRGTRFGNPYTIFTQYRSIKSPCTEGMSIGQWQQETAAEYNERYSHFKKDRLEQESQKWVKAVLEHDLRTGQSHAVSRYKNNDSVKSFKKAINDVKNLARRIVKYGKDIHIVAAVYSTDSIAQQASTIVSSDSFPYRASAMGFLGSSRLEEPWVFGEISEVAPQDSNNNAPIPAMQPADFQHEDSGQFSLNRTSQALNKTARDRPQAATRQLSPSSPHEQSITISNDPQTHLDAFNTGLSITFPTGAGEKKKFLWKFFRVVWNNMWASVLGRDTGKAFNQVLDNCLRTRHRLRGWDSTITPSPGDPGFDPNRLSVDFLSRFYEGVRAGKQIIWLEEWTADEKIISRSDREYERIPVVVDSNNKALRHVQHCPSFLRKQVKSEVTSVIDNLTQNAPIIDRARAQVNGRKLADSFANTASRNADPLADIRSLLTSIANSRDTGLPSSRPQSSLPQLNSSTSVLADPPVADVEEDDHFSELHSPGTPREAPAITMLPATAIAPTIGKIGPLRLTLPVAVTAPQRSGRISDHVLAHRRGLEGERGITPLNVNFVCRRDLHQRLATMVVDPHTDLTPTTGVGRQNWYQGITAVDEVHDIVA